MKGGRSNSKRLRFPAGAGLAVAALIIVLVLLSSPLSSASSVIILTKKAPFPSASPFNSSRHQTKGCGGSESIVHQPTFNLTTGGAKWETTASISACGTGGFAAQGVWDGVTNVRFTVSANGSYNISARWDISGALLYNITYNGTPNSALGAGARVAPALRVVDATLGKVLASTNGHGAGASTTSNGAGTLYFHISTTELARGLYLLTGHKYYITAYVTSVVGCSDSSAAAGGTVDGTLDVYSAGLGASLVSIKLLS